ncbi:MAG: hypothetical protein JO181_12840 [Solirubrobacterales bacterium]|nr:hypothetical protein [Solirubrobacterales bacterium]
MRTAWDGKPLQTITRSAPIRAREAHVPITGHITKDELLRFVTGTELANGFFNRFPVVAVQRSQELPFGGRLTGDALDHVRNATLTDLRFATLPRELHSTPKRESAGSRSPARCLAARKACSALRPAAPRRTSFASPRSTPSSTAPRRSPPPPRSRPGGLALQPRVHPLDLRRQPRRPDGG